MAVDLKKKNAIKIGGISLGTVGAILGIIAALDQIYTQHKPPNDPIQSETVIMTSEPLKEQDEIINPEIKETEPITTTTTFSTTITTTETTIETTTESLESVPLMLPYDGESYTIEDCIIGGKTYKNAPQMYLYHGSVMMFNLEGKYSKLCFDVGHVDKSTMNDATCEIYLDGKLAETLYLNSDEILIPVELDVRECHQLKITLNWTYIYATYAIVNGTLYP